MRRPRGHTAVMADKAPAVVEADDALRALWRKLEWFATAPWAGRSVGEIIVELDPGSWVAWECACGDGILAYALADYFARVHATDIHAHGGALQQLPPLDFLSPGADLVDNADWIITNPPFGLAAEFVEAGLRRARRGLAILARTALLESAARYPLFFGSRPLTAIAPFFERVPMTLGGWDPGASSATAYAWFIWVKREARPDISGGRPMVWPIPPGTRARLTEPTDARLWGRKGAAPLLEGLDG